METPPPGTFIPKNLATPLKLGSVKLSGFAGNVALPGEDVRIVQRCLLTSEQHVFHLVAPHVLQTFQAAANSSGHRVSVAGAEHIIAVIKPDETADLYLDAAACVMKVRIKDGCEYGQAVMQSNLTDILAVEFPAIAFEATDQVVVLMREGFRFSLYFDLTRDFDAEEMGLALGAGVRRVKHHECYSALANPAIFDAMNAAGWFPFIELQGSEFSQIYASLVEAGELEKLELVIVQAFTRERLEAMVARWLAQPGFKAREGLLRSGIEDYLAQRPIGAIKTLLTEIEGVLQHAHLAAASKSAKISGLIEFAVTEASKKAGGPDTLFFADAFKRYLAENLYPNFDPAKPGSDASRHAAAHGAAPADAYTMKRALQVILTLDQLYSYLL